MTTICSHCRFHKVDKFDKSELLCTRRFLINPISGECEYSYCSYVRTKIGGEYIDCKDYEESLWTKISNFLHFIFNYGKENSSNDN